MFKYINVLQRFFQTLQRAWFSRFWRVLGKRNVLLSLLCVCFVGGTIAARWLRFTSWSLIACILLLALLARRLFWLKITALLCAAMLLGCWRGSIYMARLDIYQHFQNKTVLLTGVASADAVYGNQSQLSFEMHSAQVVRDPPLVGNIAVSGFGANMVYNGDRLAVQGKLMPARGNDVARVSFAKLQVLAHRQSVVDSLRRRFTAGLESAVPEPNASFGMGLLIGQRNTLPPDVSEQLQMIGLTHIIAVSGYNLTIIMHATRRLLGKRSKYQFTAVSVALMLLFIALSGASPSIVRASVISGLSLATWYYGRELSTLTLLLFSAALTVAYNPLYAWNNISWTLSFLAFFGVIVIAPIITRRLYGSRQPKIVTAVLIESLSAELLTMPYILFIFGQLSTVSLLANLLVAAWIPLAMLLSVLAGVVGMLAPAVAGWVSWPATIIMTYMLDMTRLLAKIPHAFVQHVAFSWWQMAATYTLTTGVVLLVWQKTCRSGTITDRSELESSDI